MSASAIVQLRGAASDAPPRLARQCESLSEKQANRTWSRNVPIIEAELAPPLVRSRAICDSARSSVASAALRARRHYVTSPVARSAKIWA